MSPNPIYVRHVVAPFKKDAPEHKCCCSMIHVETGVLIFAVLDLVFSASSFCYGIFGQSGSGLGHFNIVSTVLSVCLLVSVKTKNQYFLVPYLVFSLPLIVLIGIFCMIPMAVVYVVQDDAASVLAVILVVLLVLPILALIIWPIHTVWKYYGYLSAMANQDKMISYCEAGTHPTTFNNPLTVVTQQ